LGKRSLGAGAPVLKPFVAQGLLAIIVMRLEESALPTPSKNGQLL
jgi:hypothetical protein